MLKVITTEYLMRWRNAIISLHFDYNISSIPDFKVSSTEHTTNVVVPAAKQLNDIAISCISHAEIEIIKWNSCKTFRNSAVYSYDKNLLLDNSSSRRRRDDEGGRNC